MLSKTLIYYFHYNSKESTNGLAPIYCRITVNSTPKKFATGLYVQANNWDTVKQKAKGRNEEVQFINFKLDCLTKQIKDCERKLIDTLGTFPDFVNVSPKNHLQIMGRYVDVVS